MGAVTNCGMIFQDISKGLQRYRGNWKSEYFLALASESLQKEKKLGWVSNALNSEKIFWISR